MAKDSSEDVMGFFKKEPYAFYLFKQICLYKSDRLPDFMDRGDYIELLIAEDLTRYSKAGAEKHQHYKPGHLSEIGKEICAKFRHEGTFKLLESIPVNSKDHFDLEFKRLFIDEPGWITTYDNDEELEVMGFPIIGQVRKRGKVELSILGFRSTKFQLSYIYDFHLQVKCGKCEIPFCFIQRLEYIDGIYKPFDFTSKCPKCNNNFYCNSYFSLFSMDVS